MHSGADLLSNGRRLYYSRSVTTEVRSFLPAPQCSDVSDLAITWCLHIWHPTEEIVACLNGAFKYSSPVADELGIINDLQYLQSCWYYDKEYKHCLRINHGRLFHDRAYISLTVNSSDCTVNDYYDMSLLKSWLLEILLKVSLFTFYYCYYCI